MTELSRQLSEVSIPQIESYLISTNWINDGEIRKVATVWHRADDHDAEVLLPISSRLKDFTQRLRDALIALASYERRATVEVINDVVRRFANVITVRVIGGDTSGGTIPISDGVLLISKAKELLYAAAMSMYAKKRQFTGPPPKEAKTYVDSLLLGQTEVGSYIVNVIAPLQGNAAPLNARTDQTPLAEAVTLNLTVSLEAILEASSLYETDKNLTVFDAAIAKGASANMCDALLGFSGSEQKREFQIKVSGAAGPMFEGEAKTFSFETVQIEALQKASGYYKDDYILNDREIWGFVKKLHRPQGEEMGTITIEAVIGEVERNVQIDLGPQDYHKGVVAHDTKAVVKCRGDVHVKSRSARLLNPHAFEVVDLSSLL